MIENNGGERWKKWEPTLVKVGERLAKEVTSKTLKTKDANQEEKCSRKEGIAREKKTSGGKVPCVCGFDRRPLTMEQ